MIDRPTGDEMKASAPAYAPAPRVDRPKAARRPVIEPAEPELQPVTPSNGYDGIPEEV